MTDNAIGLVSAIFATLIFSLIVWRQWNASLEKKRASAPPSYLSVDTTGEAKPTKALTVRDSMLLRMRERGASGACLHCDKAARYQRPVIRGFATWADNLASWLGSDVVRRRKVVAYRAITSAGETFDLLLCEQHKNMELAIQERKLNSLKAAMSDANAAIEKDLLEFENHMVDEEVQAFMESIRKKKPGEVQLRAVNGGNGGAQ